MRGGYSYGTVDGNAPGSPRRRNGCCGDGRWARRVLLLLSALIVSAAVSITVGAFLAPKGAVMEVLTQLGGVQIVAMVLATIIMLYGLFGFCTSMSSSRCFLGTYIAFVGLLFLAFLALVMAALSVSGKVDVDFMNKLSDNLLENGWKGMVAAGVADNPLLCALQRAQNCSGYSSPPALTNGTINNGCCAPVGCFVSDTPWPPSWQQVTCPICTDANDNRFLQTCQEPMRDFVKTHSTSVIAGVAGTATFFAIQVAAAIGICCGL